jgi:hypothetical protein
MSNENKPKNFNSLSELSNLFTAEELFDKKYVEDKQKYQENWVRVTNGHRKMIAKKNRRWLIENKESQLVEYMKMPEIYEMIKSYFEDDNRRKYMIHIITNFFPLNRTQQVSLFREENPICPFSGYKLTDLDGIRIGNRDRHIAYSGANSTVFLSGCALQELNRFVLEYTYQFDTREGQIINFALDRLRNDLSKKNK